MESNTATPKRRGRPKGSKNKIKRAMRAVKAVNRRAVNLDKDSIIAALGLLMVAIDILKRATN